MGPKGLPQPIVHKIHDSFKKALDDPEYQTVLKKYDMQTTYLNSEECEKADKLEAEKLKEMQSKWAENDAFMAKQHSENKAAREQALADGKITKDEMSTLKENRKGQRQENKEYRKEHRKNGKQKPDSATTDAATPATAQ